MKLIFDQSKRWLYRECGQVYLKANTLPTFFYIVRRISAPSAVTRCQVKENHAKRDEYEKLYYKGDPSQGIKKDVKTPLPQAYSPTYVEAAWYSWWLKEGFFTPEYQEKQCHRVNEKFVMCLPPPNVTGTLHLGHALTNSVQDAIVRWKRMKGIETVWVPGCDHAGIATQVVVEKQLKKDQNKTRFDIGREKFLTEVWQWKTEKGDRIYEQMKAMGSSLDWSRACFTMDDKLSKAVVETFVQLYEEGLIYRTNRLVNWSCSLQSTISDIEVESISIDGRTLLAVPGYEDKVEFGVLTSFDYPVEGGGEITVCTTRLETMLGDVAVAVHPNDTKYTHLHGKYVIHPTTQEKLPIICDEFVDMKLGTGAVKITPGHDYTDFDVGERHKLPSKCVISNTGTMENCHKSFVGMKRFHCRLELIKVLQEKGLFRGSESHAMTVPLCSRSNDVVEPILKDQWYLDCKEMAEKAMQVVKQKKLKLTPSTYENVWFDYLENARDWCISRQLWWGHRIPAYKVSLIGQDLKDEWIIARNKAEAISKATKAFRVTADQIVLHQDEDVLDTWFSSAIFPFSVFGWPEMTNDFQKYYPTNLLETGSDIIFFWVARMVMLGLKLTNQLPFKEVLLHGLVRDSHGRKMSKSLGNVIDPMDVIQGISLEGLHKKLLGSGLDDSEIKTAKAGQIKDFPSGISEAGADALRYSLCSVDFKAQDINMDVTHVKSNRHFCNKIWQAFKFVQMHIGEEYSPINKCDRNDLMDQWILSRLSHMVEQCDEHFQRYELQLVTQALRVFWLNDFCDIYLECIKPVLFSQKDTSAIKQTLFECVDVYLRAASPFLPFLTEELYQRLHICNSNRAESICVSRYPTTDEVPQRSKELEDLLDIVKSIASSVLSVSHEYNIKVKDMKVCVNVENDELLSQLQSERILESLKVVSKTKHIDLTNNVENVPEGCSIITLKSGLKVHCLLKGVIDPKIEVEKIQQKISSVQRKIEKLQKNQRHKRKAVAGSGTTEKIERYEKEIQHLEDRINHIQNICDA